MMTDAIDLTAFEGLSDKATVRIIPIEGGLSEQEAQPLLAVLSEMLNQWGDAGKITAGAAVLAVDGHFLIVSYELAGNDLSGCTKDQLTHTVLTFENQLGKPMLNAQRLAVFLDDTVKFMDNPTFKELRRTKSVTNETVVYDHLIASLKELRDGNFQTTVNQSWYDRIGRQYA